MSPKKRMPGITFGIGPFLMTLGVVTCLLTLPASAQEAARKPNVLLIIVDDQGNGEFGFTGNKNVQTPHMDKLTEQSAYFSNFIVATACSPTRYSLMMGRNHFKTGAGALARLGDLACDPGKRTIKGFATTGTAATYAIKVLEDGDYQLHLNGLNLNSAKGLYVKVGDQNLTIASSADQSVVFRPVAMTKGPNTITVGVSKSSNAKGKTGAALKGLRFRKMKD